MTSLNKKNLLLRFCHTKQNKLFVINNNQVRKHDKLDKIEMQNKIKLQNVKDNQINDFYILKFYLVFHFNLISF